MDKPEEVVDVDCQPLASSRPNKSPVFYRMIVPAVLQETKLRIPENFVKKLGSEVPSVATLTTPNGCAWQVGLKKIEDKVWFADGWPEFLSHQSVRVGYLLVFAYTGNSNFKVSMYDLTDAEVDYKCNPPRSSCPGPEKEDDTGSDSVEMLDPAPRRRTLRKHQNGSRPTRRLGVRCNESEHVTSEPEVKLSSLKQRPAPPRKRKRGRPKRGSDEYESSAELGTEEKTPSTRKRPRREADSRKRRETTPAGKEAVHDASKAFHSDNPFCRIIMRPSYFIKGLSLHIPASFAAKYLKEVSDYITLQASGTETWSVLCTWRDGTAKFSKGWYDFILDNNVKEDNVCIFELVDTEKFVFKVHIFRDPDDPEVAKQRAMDLLFGQNGEDD